MIQMTRILATVFVHSGTASKSTLANIGHIVSDIIPVVAPLAVIIGGAWAYFKFVRARVYRPRLEVDLSGQWSKVNGKWLLQARVIVKNIGSSKVRLLQKGTGLRPGLLAADQPPPPASSKWVSKEVFVILKEHAWIESGETISDVLLLDLGVSDPSLVRLEGRLVLGRWFGNIEFFAREVISVNANLSLAQ